MVALEKTFDRARADYVLMDYNQAPQVVVEAKKLGAQLTGNKTSLSLVSYGFQAKVASVFLTDGLCWQHFTEFHPQRQEPTRTFDLSQDDPVSFAAYLVESIDAAKFWPEALQPEAVSVKIAGLEHAIAELHRRFAELSLSPCPCSPPRPYARAARRSRNRRVEHRNRAMVQRLGCPARVHRRTEHRNRRMEHRTRRVKHRCHRLKHRNRPVV